MKTVLCLCLAVCAAAGVPLKSSEVIPNFVEYYDDNKDWYAAGLEKEANLNLLSDVSRNPANNRYLLYTRRNPSASQTLRIDNTNSIIYSQFNANNPTVVIVHGWISNQYTDLNIRVRDTFLRKSDVNIIVMEWRRLASSDYITAVAGVPAVGRGLGQFLRFLNSVTGAPFETMHLVGFSLGAHVVGNAGRELNGKVARITVSCITVCNYRVTLQILSVFILQKISGIDEF
ncbi:unnamed protein product [Euphydryas editha]|uniref:Lipase domain-containing protein n=1 Tax=Euphydryas editha TaxID=104508 RepID=A0AAU9TPU0_EUPED|nr:unnamed protein product [Euphydryas editha]